MKILLTGTGGFIGQSLKRKLEEHFSGEEIVSLKRQRSLGKGEHTVDYSDIQTMADCEACKGVDLAFHIAGITKGVSFREFYNANVVPTENLLAALERKSPSLKRFVFISSHAAAGPSQSRQHYKAESEEDNPIEYYGESKWLAEQVVKARNRSLPFTIIRPSSVYGPGDADFLNIFRMAKSGINLYSGNKDKYTSIIYIDDLVEGMIGSSLSPNAISDTYFLCNDEPVSWKQLHETIFRIMDKEPKSISIPFPAVKALSYLGDAYAHISGKCSLLNVQKIKLSEPDFWIASNQKAKKDLGYSSKIRLEDGVRSTHEHYLRNKQL
ncbi:NAD-dependent epimerase/dehydratase family protein [Candidatus Woesearchaeota archaeon]|nr:NAD-dependent epimerase/dehydratase family protein [Candidatus Woesearchaeota archaeon]